MSGLATASSIVTAIAFGYLAVISVVLAAIDISTHRLPDRIVLPSWLTGFVLFVIASVLSADPGRMTRAALGMAALFAAYFLMRVVSPGSIGGGDVKLAGLLGLYLGWIGWSALLIGSAAAFVVGGGYALVLLARRRADRHSRIPFGPAMIVGAWLGILAIGVPRAVSAG